MIYLHKFLPLIVSPLGGVIGLLLLALLFRRLWLVWTALVMLCLFALPLTGYLLWRGLEAEYPYRDISSAGRHDGVVVLSGMVSGYPSAEGVIQQWDDPDRFFTGLELRDAGKGRYLIFTRGKWPWMKTVPEGEVLRDKAIAFGVRPEDILLADGVVWNTAAEAGEIKKLMEAYGLRSVLLVTSSFHMPRAKRLFDQAGIVSEGFATDYKAEFKDISWMSVIPSAGGFKDSSSAIREYIGRLYYWLKSS